MASFVLMDHPSHIIDIPKEFYSFSSGALFERCIDCDRYLLEKETEYFIEKAIKKYDGYAAQDVIFEYAICSDCAERVRKDMSKESLKKVENFFLHQVDMMQRMEMIMDNPGNPSAYINQCLVMGTNVEDLQEFQLYAHCKGDKLELGQMPYLISGAVLDEIQHLLSSQTLDELNGFMGKHFGPAPDLMEPIPSRRVVLV